jgi:hypothetical protein
VKRVLYCAVAVLGLALANGAGATDPDPFVGTWMLDPAASRYDAGEKPASMLILMDRSEDALHYQSCTKLADGRASYAEYTARYDGRPVMVIGNSGVMLPVSLRHVADATVIATYTRGFQVVATSERQLQDHGARMLVTTTIRQPDGTSRSNVGVYRRVPVDATLSAQSCQPVPTAVGPD